MARPKKVGGRRSIVWRPIDKDRLAKLTEHFQSKTEAKLSEQDIVRMSLCLAFDVVTTRAGEAAPQGST